MGWSWNDIREDFGNVVKAADKVYYDTVDIVNNSGDELDGTNEKLAEEQKRKKKKADIDEDAIALSKFKNQDFLNTEADLYKPQFKTYAAQEESNSMLTLFNARKDQVMANRRTPGISQTRF